MIRLFYAVPDVYPPWRLDVEELFSKQLPRHGVDVVWSMRRMDAGRCQQVKFNSQTAYLPLRVNLGGAIGRSVNKLLQYACDIGIFVRLLLGSRFDVIQVRDRRYFFAFFGWLVSRIRKVKFVYWLSYPFPEYLMEIANQEKGIKGTICRLRGQLSWFYVYRVVMVVADHVFVQSDQMRDDLVGYGVVRDKLTPVPMGVPNALLEQAKSGNRQNIESGKIVYIGTMARVRQLNVVIAAFAMVRKRVPNAHLVMVGDGDTASERQELEALVHQSNLGGCVTFTGFVSMTEAWAHAATAEVCLSPFFPTFVLRSTSPTKLIEYMALGRPLVANDHPEQSSVLHDSGAGICVPWGAESFASAIVKLLSDKTMTREMEARGPRWVAANRTYEKISAAVFAHYQSLLGQHK